jgi:hypothetical protein
MVRAFGLATDVPGFARAVRLAERVAAGDQRDGLLVVHCHARERLADVARRSDRVGLPVRAFGIDVDEAHLHRAERMGEIAIAAVALVAEPRGLGTPVDVLRLPDVLAAAAEAERAQAHRFERDVAGKDHEIGPRELPAVLLLDRPEEATRLVEVAVVGPAVQRREALLAGARSAAAVVDAIRAGAVPCHADEERTVMAVVGRPPRLRIGHQRREIVDDGVEVERLELGRIVEILDHRIGQRGMLVQDRKVELVGPPLRVRLDLANAGKRTLRLAGHELLLGAESHRPDESPLQRSIAEIVCSDRTD